MLYDKHGLDLVVAGLVVSALVLVSRDLGGVDEAEHLHGLLGVCHRVQITKGTVGDRGSSDQLALVESGGGPPHNQIIHPNKSKFDPQSKSNQKENYFPHLY